MGRGGRTGKEAAGSGAGFVLPVVLLLLLALTLLVHGGLALLRVQHRAGRAGGLAVRARLLAEGAVREAGARFSPEGRAPWTSVPVLASSPEDDAEVGVTLHWLAREWILLDARARTGRADFRARRRVGRVHWLLEPVARLGAARAALESPAPSEGTGVVDGAGVADPPPDWPAGVCDPHRSALDSLFAGGGLPGWSRIVPPPGGGSPEQMPGLGLLDGNAIVDRAHVRVEGTVGPRPSIRLGRCDGSGESNWGAPSEPLGPCGDRHLVVASAGPLVVDGGEGQGLLAVEGDLTLRDHRFSGVVLVGGALRLVDGAEIHGLVRTRGPVSLGAGSRLLASGCAVLRGLWSPPLRRSLGRPLPLPGGPWIRLP